MSTPFQAIAAAAANQAGIDTNIFIRQIQAESGFNQWAKSPAGAEGIAQFMPDTARSMGVDPWNVQSSLTGAALLDARNLKKYNGDYSKALAAYNAGGGSVDHAVNSYGGDWLAHMPGETQNYVKTIVGNGSSNKVPGTNDPCLGCGAIGSIAYTQCHAALAAKVGNPPPCSQAGITQNKTEIGNAIGSIVTDPIMSAIQAAFKPLFDALPSFGIHIALFFGALMLLIVGLWVLTRDPMNDTGSAINTGLNKIAGSNLK